MAKAVAAGQKNGFFHVLAAETGELLRQRQFVQTGGLGGFFADSAQVGGLAFANAHNWPGYRGGETGGLLATLQDAITGDAPDPEDGHIFAIRANADGLPAVWDFAVWETSMMSGVAVANGVVYFHATTEGYLYALDATNGHLLTKLPVFAVSGPSVAGGQVFIGFGDLSGFSCPPDPVTGGIKAFGLPWPSLRLCGRWRHASRSHDAPP